MLSAMCLAGVSCFALHRLLEFFHAFGIFSGHPKRVALWGGLCSRGLFTKQKMIIRNQPITSRRDNEQLAWGNAPGGRQYDKRPARAKALLFFCAFALALTLQP